MLQPLLGSGQQEIASPAFTLVNIYKFISFITAWPLPFWWATGFPAEPRGAKKNKWTWGLAWDTTGFVTARKMVGFHDKHDQWSTSPLKYKFSACIGISTLSEPSLNRLPQLHGTKLLSFSFCMRTTGFRMPGTAADANKALQITVSGAVI